MSSVEGRDPLASRDQRHLQHERQRQVGRRGPSALQEIEADYWDQTKLDGLLLEHPEVDRAFFENETRVFMTLPEARELALSQEPFLRDRLGDFFGREPEVTATLDFLTSPERFLVLQGPGGIGRTRLLIQLRVGGRGEGRLAGAVGERRIDGRERRLVRRN